MAPFAVEAADVVKTCPNCGQRVKVRLAFGSFVCPLCGHKWGGAGGHEAKEGARMAPQTSDVTQLLREAARADTYSEQERLIGAAEDAKEQIQRAAVQEREVDLASAVVADRLTPVRVHEHHTAATDWLGDMDTATPANAENEMIAHGSVWYAKLHEAVKQHPDELAQQALGMAQRLAGRFGAGADQAEKAFLDHVGGLHARDVHQGLIRLAASVDGPGVEGEQVTMGLPGELTSSERAPAMKDLADNTSGGSISDSSWPAPLELPQQDVDAVNGDSGTSSDHASKAASLQRAAEFSVGTGHPSDMAWNRWGNWKPGWQAHQHGFVDGANHKPKEPAELAKGNGLGQAYGEGHDLAQHYHANGMDPEEHFTHHDWSGGQAFSEDLGKKIFGSTTRKEASMPQHTAACPECSGCQACGGTHRVAVRAPRTAASGLDQVDQTIDPHDNPKATPYPTAVAFPWEAPDDSSATIQEAEGQIADREKLKGASRRQHAVQAARFAAQRAFMQVMAGQDDSGWAGDMGAGGVSPGQQDGGNPGTTYPGNLTDADPVYGQGGDNGNQPLKPYGADEADDYTNNPGMNIQPGAPMQYDQGGRVNQVGASRRSDQDPQIQQALAFVRSRRQELDGR